MVEIPSSLAEKIDRLGPRFCLVKARDKDPSIGGKGWQLPENLMYSTNPKLQKHLENGGNYGVCGGNHLTIIDADAEEVKQAILRGLPETFTVRSPGSGGYHFYFLCADLRKKYALRDEGGENTGHIQGDGKMVVGPGCVHPKGGIYEIIKDVLFARVTDQQICDALRKFIVPEEELQKIEEAARRERTETNIDLDILQVVSLAGLYRQGNEYYGPHPIHGSKTGRNFWINPSKNVWHCFRDGTGGGPLLWLAVEERIINCAEAGPGALRGETFKKVLEKARERGLIKKDGGAKKQRPNDGEESRKSQADRLVEYCLSQQPALFHDQHKTPYARVDQNGISVTITLRSRQFKAWLASLMWQTEKKAPGTEALYSAIHVLEAMALYDGKQYTLWNRVAPAEDGIWIDMTDEKWRAIKVTAEGWCIVKNPPILFKRYSHQTPLVEPKSGGNPWRFLEFANISPEDGATLLLLLVAIITFLIPSIPHVIIILYGIQGSGKTLLFRLIRSLIDPSSIDVLAMPEDERERIQQLDHHWLAFYDNVTNLPTYFSDTLCRAATGGGFSKRELYTDDDDIIYNFKRCVGLNGINIAAQRGDLLDRSLLIGLQDIPKEKRKEEKQILTDFENCKAEILGGILDVLVNAIRMYPSVNRKELFRMADFTKWGCAIAHALGRTEEEFISAYSSKVIMQIEEAAHSSPMATVLLDYMENYKDYKEWEGTPSKLFKELQEHAKLIGISTRQKTWPKAPHVLVRNLNDLIPSLKALGLEIVTGIRTGTARKISITRSVTTVTSDIPEKPKNDSNDASDASGTISFRHFSLDEVVGYKSMDLSHIGQCALCGQKPATLTHSVKTFQNHFQVCEDCARQIKDYLKKGV